MDDQFSRLEGLYGNQSLVRLKDKTVCVIGTGGVGSFAVEALARMGVGRFILVDGDRIEASNLNRQLIALHSTIGRYKVHVFEERLKDINPAVRVTAYPVRYDASTRETILTEPIDFLFDAMDSLRWKIDLAATCRAKGIALLTSCGQGNRLRSAEVGIQDLFTTAYDPLARRMRKGLRRLGITTGVPVVYSKEHPFKSKDREPPASNPFVPPTAGLRAAEYITKKLME